jgi:hypothetical protein
MLSEKWREIFNHTENGRKLNKNTGIFPRLCEKSGVFSHESFTQNILCVILAALDIFMSTGLIHLPQMRHTIEREKENRD